MPGHALLEAEVNLFCVRSDAASRPFPWTNQALDWKKVLEFAQIHGVLQFLADYLEATRLDLPDPWREILAAQRRRNAVRSMVQHRECAVVLRALSEAGIAAVPFKGTSLSKLLYGRVADRISSDVDILIRAADLMRTRTILESHGFTPVESASRMAIDALLASGIEMAFVNSNGVIVEVHWRVLEPGQAFGFPNDFESLRIDGDHIANEDLFIILVMHGLAHRWEMLKWIVDIDAFLRNVPIDWKAVWKRAGETGTCRATNIALLLVHDLLGTPLPTPIADAKAERLARSYSRHLLEGGRIPAVADFRMQMAARERWIDRRRFIGFVARVKPWDHDTPGPKALARVVRLLTRGFRSSQLADAQKIPELHVSATSRGSDTR
jgi:hypothetical protein